MSWLSYCYKTYQNSVSEIGKQQPGKVPLLPVAHTTQQVNIEVELDKDGNFQYAGLLAQDQRTTIIPCTEECKAETSDNRTTDSLYYQWGALPAGFDDQRGRSGNKQHWPGLLGTTKNTKHCLRPCAWVLS